MYKLFLALSLLWLTIQASGQGSALPLGNLAYQYVERLEIKTGQIAPMHSAIKNFSRGDVTRYALLLDTLSSIELSTQDKNDLSYIFRDNNEWLGAAYYATTIAGQKEQLKGGLSQTQASLADSRFEYSRRPIWKEIYKTPANFLDFNQKHFYLRVNPLLHFKYAKDSKNDGAVVFKNLRGIQVRGGIDDRIYFFMNILETQSKFAHYTNEWIAARKTIPGQGLYKNYSSEVFDIKGGYDYLNGQGYVGFNLTRHVGMQLGYGKNFIGNGYRSLILSDFANNYFYLKLNWKIWKFHYQNIFSELASHTKKGSDGLLPKRYTASHYLSIRPIPNMEIGIFETVVFSRNNHFEFQYLNPIIFYRLTEQALGSPDNAMIGFNGKWNIFKRFQLYGQLIFDEFVFSELFVERRGWWGNKFGIQAGIKYVDVLGIDHLDIQGEINIVRPYTYTHRDSTAYYAHYDQPLAHPLGANFQEIGIFATYQWRNQWHLSAKMLLAEYGEDNDADTNWGGNILKSYNTRQQTYNNELGQGVKAQSMLINAVLSYQLRHNLFVDVEYFYRNKDSEIDDWDQQTQYIGGGIRLNIFDTDNTHF